MLEASITLNRSRLCLWVTLLCHISSLPSGTSPTTRRCHMKSTLKGHWLFLCTSWLSAHFSSHLKDFRLNLFAAIAIYEHHPQKTCVQDNSFLNCILKPNQCTLLVVVLLIYPIDNARKLIGFFFNIRSYYPVNNSQIYWIIFIDNLEEEIYLVTIVSSNTDFSHVLFLAAFGYSAIIPPRVCPFFKSVSRKLDMFLLRNIGDNC